jgi:hypothetical protein
MITLSGSATEQWVLVQDAHIYFATQEDGTRLAWVGIIEEVT